MKRFIMAGALVSLLCLSGCSTSTVAELDPIALDLPEIAIPNANEESDPESKNTPETFLVTDSGNKTSKPPMSDSGSGASNNASSAQSHTHSWTYHEAQYDSVWHNAVTKPVSICNTCGADITGNTSSHLKSHALNGEDASYRSDSIVITPAYEEQVLVKAGYYSCSCGVTK